MTTPIPSLAPNTDHRDAERAFTAAGWSRIGAGDWAIALLSPDGRTVARISPFDPTGPYTAELYQRAAHTLLVPQLLEHHRLDGGGDLLLMERLHPVDPADAAGLHRLIADEDESVAELTGICGRSMRAPSPSCPGAGRSTTIRRTSCAGPMAGSS